MKGTVIMILEKEGEAANQFFYLLSQYCDMQQYEWIFALEADFCDQFDYYIQKYFPENENIRKYLVNQIGNYGMIYNGAAELATESAVIFLNQDVIPIEDCMDLLVDRLEEGNIMACQPLLVDFHSQRVKNAGCVFSKMFVSDAFRNRRISDEEVLISGERSAMDSSMFAVNRYVFEELGGFDEELPNCWQGIELTMRIMIAGGQNYYEAAARAYQLCRDEKERNTKIYLPYWKNYSLPEEIFYEIERFFLRQAQNLEFQKEYILINFSDCQFPQNIFRHIHIKIVKVLHIPQGKDCIKIDLEKVLPFSMMEEERAYLYLADNFMQLVENRTWLQMRGERGDLFADLCGSLFPVQDWFL